VSQEFSYLFLVKIEKKRGRVTVRPCRHACRGGKIYAFWILGFERRSKADPVHITAVLLFASLPDCARGQNQTAVSDEQYSLSDF
jgi:hypothetical protein